MRTAIVFFIILLFIWKGGSSYAYVCKVRKNCTTENG